MSTTRRIAQSPFDDTEANVVLRTSDNVDFYVYKDILKVSSPFFRTLFSLPQPTAPHPLKSQHNAVIGDETTPEGLPIIPVSEGCEALEYVLRICYPINYPDRVQSLLTTEKALATALKYDIDRAIAFLKEDFTRLGSDNPSWMYMVACRLHLEQEARVAADLLRTKYYPQNKPNSLPKDADSARIAVEVYREGYEELPAIHLYRLLRHICFDIPISFKDDRTSITKFAVSILFYAHPKLEFPETMSSLPPDVLLQSTEGQVIPVHEVVLRLVSAKTILQKLESDGCPRQDGLPLVLLQHSARTLISLLNACYLSTGSSFGDFRDDDYDLFSVAQSYGMHGIAAMLKSRWLLHAQEIKSPLGLYLRASLYGWKADAWRAARRLASGMPPDAILFAYCEEMNMAGTIGHYHTLLKSMHEVHRAEVEVLKGAGIFPAKANETWNEPTFACTPSISPVIVARAMQHFDATIRDFVDPADSIEFFGSLSFSRRPSTFIRKMVLDSETYNKKRQQAISDVSFHCEELHAQTNYTGV